MGNGASRGTPCLIRRDDLRRAVGTIDHEPLAALSNAATLTDCATGNPLHIRYGILYPSKTARRRRTVPCAISVIDSVHLP